MAIRRHVDMNWRPCAIERTERHVARACGLVPYSQRWVVHETNEEDPGLANM